ncbi:type I secretion C-terminal target domain-containing protein [Acinetobacter guillouiae]
MDPVTGKSDNANLTIQIGTNSNDEAISRLAINADEYYETSVGDDIVTASVGDEIITSTASHDIITTGAGADTVVYNLLNVADATGGNGTDEWTDFKLAQGDKVDVRALLDGANADNIANYVSVTSDGEGNTLISIDRDGTGNAYNSTDLIVLKNTDTTLDELLNNNQLLF